MKWLEIKEKQLNEQMNAIEEELSIVEKVKGYLQQNYFNNDAQELFQAYIKHIEGYCNWSKVVIDGEEKDPNESLMRRIEESIGISENAKKAFREEVLIRISSFSRKGKKVDYTFHDRLREAIEKSL
jgi:serine protein kinase